MDSNLEIYEAEIRRVEIKIINKQEIIKLLTDKTVIHSEALVEKVIKRLSEELEELEERRTGLIHHKNLEQCSGGTNKE